MPPKQNKPDPFATGQIDPVTGKPIPKRTYHREAPPEETPEKAPPAAKKPAAKKLPTRKPKAAPGAASAKAGGKASATPEKPAAKTKSKIPAKSAAAAKRAEKPTETPPPAPGTEAGAAAQPEAPPQPVATVQNQRTGAIYAAEVRAAARRRAAQEQAGPAMETLLAESEPAAPSTTNAAGEALPETAPPAEDTAPLSPTPPPEPTPETPEPEPAAPLPPRLPNPFLKALGSLLYTLGFGAEYWVIRACRALREAAIVLGQFLAWAFSGLGRGLLSGLRSIGRDFAAPFKRFARRRRQLRRIRTRQAARQAAGKDAGASYTGARIRYSMSLLMHIVSIVLPLAAAAALAFTVYGVVNTQYALAVEINGVVVGHVTDKSVVENAKGLLRDRIRLAPNQSLGDWQLNPGYALAKASRFTTAQQLVNEILLHSADDPTDLVNATGLYIDGALFAVTTRGDELRTWLNDRLASYRSTAHGGAEVAFVKQVECEPNTEDLFFASAVQDYDALLESLTRIVSPEITYTASGEASLSDIAHNNNLTLDMLLARNPQYAEEADDFEPEAGSVLLIRRDQPFLQVQTSVRRMSTEVIPYATEEVETDERPKGAVVTVQQGEDGEQQVWDDYVYIDGELDRRVRVEELSVITKMAVTEKIEIGTKVISIDLGDLVLPEGGYGGFYMFPVPGYSYISRGYAPGGHRGLDIIAAEGTGIHAAEGGTVSTAGWHYSWGNYIVIQHPGGVATLYAHCSALYVSAGQEVGQGALIGAVGNTGNSYGAHLHLEVTVGGSLVDPFAYVGG